VTAPAGRPVATRIAVTSGKGGVGKTSLAVNLAVALARLGHRVGIVDADFALGNVDVVLGLTPEDHLGAVLSGTRDLRAITLDGPSGVRVIPAGSGVRALTSLDDAMWVRFVQAIRDASHDLDFLIFDTATGIADNVLDVVGLADHVLVVTSYDPASVVDAYALIKLITASEPQKSIGVIVNAARDSEEGGIVFRQISLAADRFLGRSLRYEGHVPEDQTVKDCGLAQEPFVGRDARSPADRQIRRLASRLAATRPGTGPWPGRPAEVSVKRLAEMEAPRCA
jgi:flagellar biosynthesis protein FlhG